MDIEKFVQNVKFYCSAKGIKPTNACRESGAGKSLIDQMERRGSIPSVEKVQMLAQYLGVTVSELLGETPGNVSELDTADRELLAAYHRASTDDQQAISLILNKYREKESASQIG